jgi:hypothetical protein
MADRLPDAVRWRRGKEDLGWPFTAALIEKTRGRLSANLDANAQLLKPYIDLDALRHVRQMATNGSDGGEENKQTEYDVAHLAVWLSRHKERPKLVGELQSIELTNQALSRSSVEEEGGQSKGLTAAERQLRARANKRQGVLSRA